MMFYDHAVAFQNGKKVDYDLEPPPLEIPGVKVTQEGHRVLNR